MRRFSLLVATFALAGCASTRLSAPGETVLTGSWGGPHIGLVLDPNGGRLDYDCAAGTIDQPVALTPQGEFSAVGRHTPGMGGPERVGEVRPSYAAVYSGRVVGDRMTLIVRWEANGADEASYSLRRNETPQLMRCL